MTDTSQKLWQGIKKYFNALPNKQNEEETILSIICPFAPQKGMYSMAKEHR